MTPKEKAKELVDNMGAEFSFAIEYGDTKAMSKNVALICIDEILKAGSQKIVSEYFDDRYWQEVKQEIINL